MKFKGKKSEFLDNPSNKQRFINLLANTFKLAGIEVFNAKSDADTLIVATTIESSKRQATVLVRDDTDLLVLLLYHDIYFKPEAKKSVKKIRCWTIKHAKAKLGPLICDNILFLHAILGCDSTSRLFGIGKAKILKFAENEEFNQTAQVFHNSESQKEEMVACGEKALVMIYGGKTGENLNELRFKIL